MFLTELFRYYDGRGIGKIKDVSGYQYDDTITGHSH